MFSSRKNHDSDESNTPYGTGASNTDSSRGPHKSSLLNKLDPRVDSTTGQSKSSTRDDGGALGTGRGYENTGHGTSHTGNTGYGSGLTGRDTTTSNTGPHNSSLAKKMDPRVSSDQDGNTTSTSRDSGYNTQYHSGHSNPSSLTGHGTSNTTSSPHSSNLANKIDPRVDSDNSQANHGQPPGGVYSSPTASNHGNPSSGPHNSTLANKADPRVDSDNSRSGYGHTTSPYNNPRPNQSTTTTTPTAGPHKSNFMNKLDPRVDSDMDASRNTTAGTTNQGYGPATTPTQPMIIPQEISSHGHATGLSPAAFEGRHAKHTAGNISNATASASVSGGAVPEGTANASGPTSADAGTTSSNQGGLMGVVKGMMQGHDNNDGHRVGGVGGGAGGQNQGEYGSRNRNY